MIDQDILRKAEKLLGAEAVAGIMSKTREQLEDDIVMAMREIEEARADLKANPKYQEIVENKKALESSLRELSKINNAKVKLAVQLLQERGQ